MVKIGVHPTEVIAKLNRGINFLDHPVYKPQNDPGTKWKKWQHVFCVFITLFRLT